MDLVKIKLQAFVFSGNDAKKRAVTARDMIDVINNATIGELSDDASILQDEARRSMFLCLKTFKGPLPWRTYRIRLYRIIKVLIRGFW